jgi:hypothetical protein
MLVSVHLTTRSLFVLDWVVDTDEKTRGRQTRAQPQG